MSNLTHVLRVSITVIKLVTSEQLGEGRVNFSFHIPVTDCHEGEVRAGTQGMKPEAGIEVGGMKKHCLLAWSLGFLQSIFLYTKEHREVTAHSELSLQSQSSVKRAPRVCSQAKLLGPFLN